MSSKNFRRKEPKKRNPVKRDMDKVYSQKAFRNLRRDLSIEAVDQELNDYLEGKQDG